MDQPAVAAPRGAHARRSRAQHDRSASVPPGQGRFLRFYLLLFGADALLGWLAWTMAQPITHGLEYPLWSLRGAVASALSDVVVFGGLLALVAVRVVHHERRCFVDLGLRGPGRSSEFRRGYGLGLAWTAGAMVVAVAAGWTVVSGSVQPSTLLAFAPLWMVVTAFQAGVEEVIFRGWMLPLLAQRWGPYEAVTVQALLFGCLHLLVDANTTLAVLHGLVFGAFAGLYVLYRHGIWGAIGIHSAYNFAAIPLISLSTGGKYGPAGWHYAAITLTGIGVVVMLALDIRDRRRR
ncbi:CPBP family intramembrane glutamic endopeptidase [Streptomyces yokosukanensis]|uniref:CPBP family intramembrane glutamic endopeptidase n=1 Tax=Streptomyces yokosukanensis TaxID=67386 RepID=UPI003424FB44